MDSEGALIDDTAPLNPVPVTKSKMGCCRAGPAAIASGICAAVCLGFAIGFPYLFTLVLDTELALTQGTISTKMWEKAPIPMYIRFYLFNITNAAEVEQDYRVVPHLQELGPYTYQEWHERAFVNYHDNNYTVTFHQNRTWKFVPELSNGTESDPVTVLNVPLVSAAYLLRHQSWWIKDGFEAFIRFTKSKIFVNTNVSDILFEGYEDPLLEFSYNLSTIVPGIPPYDRFGWFYNRSGNPYFDGVFHMNTGGDDVMKSGVIREWNYQPQIPFLESPCGMLNGSFGEAWPPRRTNDSISLFAVDLCRSVKLDYKEDVYPFGVKTYRYWGAPSLFANKTYNPDNWCFAPKELPERDNTPSGLLDSSGCRFGAPAYVSFPRFLHADPWLRHPEHVVGVPDPVEDDHMFNVDLEPRTGVPFAVNARFQINIMTTPDDRISIMKGMPRRYLPVMWFAVRAEMNDQIAGWVRFVLAAPTAGIAIFYSLFGLLLVMTISFSYRFYSDRQKSRMIPNSNTPSEY